MGLGTPTLVAVAPAALLCQASYFGTAAELELLGSQHRRSLCFSSRDPLGLASPAYDLHALHGGHCVVAAGVRKPQQPCALLSAGLSGFYPAGSADQPT